MDQIYQMKSSFDEGATWYQLEWLNVGFREFEAVGLKCNSIEELTSEILEAFPECQLKYEYIGERKKKVTSTAEPAKKRKSKKK